MRDPDDSPLEIAPPAGRADAYAPEPRIDGDGAPFVFVPGMDGTGQLFHRQLPRLVGAYRVATYALRDDAPSMDVLVADLAEVVRRVGGGRPATITGESFGGTLAMSFALAHPELVERLVIVNSFPRFVPQYRLALAIAGARLMPWRAMPLVRRVSAIRLQSRHTEREQVRHFLRVTASTTRTAYLSRLRILQRFDLRDRLSELRMPTLLLASERDQLLPSLAHARFMVERIPNATLRVLPGHGHACLVAPDVDVAALLREWRESAAAAR